MEFLIAQPTPKGTLLRWLKDESTEFDLVAEEFLGSPPSKTLDIEFTRLALGLSLTTPYTLVVIGERIYQDSRIFLVIGEDSLDTPQDLFNRAIALKDQYHISFVFAPDQPNEVVQLLRSTEGLSYYTDSLDAVALQRWPTFVNFDTTARLSTKEIPKDDTLHAQLEVLLDQRTTDPRTGSPLIGTDGEELPSVIFPHEFQNKDTLASIRRSTPDYSIPLWLALYGLESSPTHTTPQYVQRDQLKTTNNPAGY